MSVWFHRYTCLKLFSMSKSCLCNRSSGWFCRVCFRDV